MVAGRATEGCLGVGQADLCGVAANFSGAPPTGPRWPLVQAKWACGQPNEIDSRAAIITIPSQCTEAAGRRKLESSVRTEWGELVGQIRPRLVLDNVRGAHRRETD